MSINENFDQLERRLAASIEANQENYRYFGGTAYLGIPQNNDFINLYIEGIKRYGLNNGTSRGNNVQLGIYNEAEQFTAKRYGADAALITSSGYLAAKLTVQAYKKSGVIRYAPNTHPALWLDGNPSNTKAFEAWAVEIVEEINNSEATHWVLLSNSMNNLYPEIYDFTFIKNISPEKKIVLIVDDSHGIGMLNDGDSVWRTLPQLPHIEVVVVASMAKALGIDAGVVLGDSASIAKLKQSDEFYGASPPSAAALYAFIHTQEIYRQAYQQLQQHITQFAKSITDVQNWHYVAGFPVFLCKKEHIEQKLLEEKILISSFPYPDRNGKNLNRIVLSSWHSETDISALIAALHN